jgi:lysophospholipase L1-like esterase
MGATSVSRYVQVTAVSLSTEPPDRLVLAPGDGVAIIGDSLAAGLQGMIAYQDPKTHRYKGALTYELEQRGVRVDGLAVGGTKAVHWMEGGRLHGTLAAALLKKPKAVVISLGTNDVFFGRDEAPAFKARMEKLAREIRNAGATPVFLGIPPLPKGTKPAEQARIEAARQVLIDVAREPSVRGVYIPPPPVALERFAADPIHPSPAGNRVWAQYLRKHLTRDASRT